MHRVTLGALVIYSLITPIGAQLGSPLATIDRL